MYTKAELTKYKGCRVSVSFKPNGAAHKFTGIIIALTQTRTILNVSQGDGNKDCQELPILNSNILHIEKLKSFASYQKKANKFIGDLEYQKAYDVVFGIMNLFHLPEQQKYIKDTCDNCKVKLFSKC